MRTTLRVVLTLAFVIAAFVASPSRAAWQLNGNPLCTMTGAQSNARCAPDGTGGAVILWTDERRGAGLIDLYGTRILGDGTFAPGWPDGGVALTTSGRAKSWSIVGDGAGGLLAFWLDKASNQAYQQHVGGDGTLAPGFAANGNLLPITVGGPSGYVLQAVTDGAGGAYLMWNAWNGTYDGLYVTRIDANGGFAPGWTASGVVRAGSDPFNMFSGMSAMTIGADPSGGVLTASLTPIEDFPSGGHVAAAFTQTPPTGVGGFAVGPPSPPSDFAPISMVADGAGGLFASWASASAPTRRMQHYLANGSAAWPEPTAAPWNENLLRDGSGGIYFFGHSPSPDQLELHRRASDASIPAPWTPSGVVVSNAGSFTTFGAVRSGSLVYTTWCNGASGANDVRACAVTADGQIASGWTANGIVVCDAPNDQVMTSMIEMPPSDALVVWADARSGEPDIYAALLAPPGPPPLAVPPSPPGGALALALGPNPATGLAHVSFTLPEAGPAAIELLDLGGRVLLHRDADARSGPQSLAIDTARFPAGIYWARLRQADHVTSSRFAVVH